MERRYKSLKEFYPFYLTEHKDSVCRGLHFVGTFILILIAIFIVVSARWSLIWTIPLVGYGFAWVGHAFFEKNKPATFQYPFYSLASDFIMFYDILTGRLTRRMEEAKVLIAQKKTVED